MAKKNDDTIFWVAGILLLLLVVTQQNVNQEEDFSMRINYYKDGVQVFHKNLFSIVTGSYDQISFNIYGTNEGGFNLTDMQIVDASPIEFKNALPTTNQTLEVGETNKLLWTSDLINITIFEALSQPVRFWFNISANAEDVETVYQEGDINLTIEGEAPVSTLTNNLIAFFKFDVSSNLVDELGNYPGTNYGGITLVGGKINSAYSFDETDYIEFSSFESLAWKDFTISVWLYVSDTTPAERNIFFAQGSVLSGNRALHAMIEPDGRVGIDFYLNSLYTSPNILNVGWNHVVIVFSDSADFRKIYINGIEEASEYEGSSFIGDNVTYIARATWGGSNYYGLMDDLGVWLEAFSPQKVNEIYNSGNDLTYPFT